MNLVDALKTLLKLLEQKLNKLASEPYNQALRRDCAGLIRALRELTTIQGEY